MFSSLNLIGRLGREPELIQPEDKQAFVRFPLACRQRDGTTIWVQGIAFGNNAQIIYQYCNKGDKIFICGGLQLFKTKDKAGIENTYIQCVVDRVVFLGENTSNSGDWIDRNVKD